MKTHVPFTINYFPRNFFGSLWNFVVSGLILLIAFNVNIWDMFGVEKPESLVWIIGFLFFVGCYGIGYYLVSKKLDENHSVILIGIIAKIGVFILLLSFFIAGDMGVLVFILGCGDLICAILFIEFLKNFEKNSK